MVSIGLTNYPVISWNTNEASKKFVVAYYIWVPLIKGLRVCVQNKCSRIVHYPYGMRIQWKVLLALKVLSCNWKKLVTPNYFKGFTYYINCTINRVWQSQTDFFSGKIFLNWESWPLFTIINISFIPINIRTDRG